MKLYVLGDELFMSIVDLRIYGTSNMSISTYKPQLAINVGNCIGSLDIEIDATFP